jgi:DNA-directed RNA polymerase subunit F
MREEHYSEEPKNHHLYYRSKEFEMFDTHKAVKEIQDAGKLSEKAAEAIVNVISRTHRDISHLATKDDLKLLKDDMRKELRSLEDKMATKDEMRKELRSLEDKMATKEDLYKMQAMLTDMYANLVKWLAAGIIGIIGTGVGILVKAFF